MPRLRWLRYAPIAVLVLVLLGLGSALTVSKLEENNHFCTICHLEQEGTFVARADMAAGKPNTSTDLASFHFAKGYPTTSGSVPINCVGCHRGDQSLGNRVESLGLGAVNSLKFVVGERGPHGLATVRALPDASCEGCHAAIYNDKTFNNHFHNRLLEYRTLPQVVANPTTNTLYCADCHKPHDQANVSDGFQKSASTFPTCEKCHQVWGRGPKRIQ